MKLNKKDHKFTMILAKTEKQINAINDNQRLYDDKHNRIIELESNNNMYNDIKRQLENDDIRLKNIVENLNSEQKII